MLNKYISIFSSFIKCFNLLTIHNSRIKHLKKQQIDSSKSYIQKPNQSTSKNSNTT